MIKNKIDIEQVNDTVVLKVGNITMDFDYVTAIKMANMIKFRAKQAKLFAGDFSIIKDSIADLGTVESNYERFIKPNNKYTLERNLGGGT